MAAVFASPNNSIAPYYIQIKQGIYEEYFSRHSIRTPRRECTILGTIDFICGDAIAVFQDCLIEVRKPLKGQYIVITAQQRNDKTKPT
ncbi:hypothetical protein H5410_052220 [Solanum commersonii]|uniref:Pectinesterase catalytic domain-containing protein n=1 Tax=Solanum commersonii TaxID=4109 RepID=A0A9J5X084_SOLCO|nr:hypothetical protein H5410_052220 [Solanum commersonii]